MIRKTWRLLAAFTAFGVIGLGLIGPGLSRPASADSGTQIADCSFSTLKADLEGGGDYYYAPGQCPNPIVFTDTITLTSSASLTEYGDDVTLDGGGQVQLFSVNSWTASLDLTGLTLSSGSAPGGTWGGGAITNFGTVRVTDSMFTDNNDGNTPAYGGGAILNAPGASLTITDSTFASNYDASWRGVGGGAIYNFAGTVDITNSTFADNWAGGPGSAIHNESGAVTVSNSTVTGSLLGYAALYGDSGSTFTIGGSIVAGNSPANCSANVIDNGYNLEDDAGASCGFTAANHDIVGGDPQLDPNGLQDNGGPTRTVALRPGSPARDAIPPSTGLCPTGDQRGQIRPGNGGDACDIGAYEFQEAPTRTTLSSSVNPSTVGQQVTFTATVSPAPDGGTVACPGRRQLDQRLRQPAGRPCGPGHL